MAELDLQHGGKTGGIDVIGRNYVTVTVYIGAEVCLNIYRKTPQGSGGDILGTCPNPNS